MCVCVWGSEREQESLQFCFFSDQWGDFKVDWKNKLSGRTLLKRNRLLSFHSTPLSSTKRVWVGDRVWVWALPGSALLLYVCNMLLGLCYVCSSLWFVVSVLGQVPAFILCKKYLQAWPNQEKAFHRIALHWVWRQTNTQALYSYIYVFPCRLFLRLYIIKLLSFAYGAYWFSLHVITLG